MYCLHCGKEVKNEEATFCPFCAKPLRTSSSTSTTTKSQSSLPKVAGILTIIGACITLIVSILVFLELGSRRVFPFSEPEHIAYLLIVVINIISFSLGLTVGLFFIKRRRFGLAMLGASLILVAGFLTIVLLGWHGTTIFAIILFGLVPIFLSIPSIISGALSKENFT